jgi:hypothetical protein
LPNYVRDILGSGKFAIAFPQIGNSRDRFGSKIKANRKPLIVRFLH